MNKSCVAALAMIGSTLLAAMGGSGAEEIRITTVGETITAAKIAYQGKTNLSVTRGDGTAVTVAVGDLIELRVANAPAAAVPEGCSGIELINGDLLVGKIAQGAEGMVTIETSHIGKCVVPFDVVRTVSLPDSMRNRRREEVDTSKGDVLRFINGDVDIGRLVSVSPNGVAFKSQQMGDTTVGLDKLSSVFLEALEEQPKPPAGALIGEITLTDGTRVTATISSITADGAYSIASTQIPAVKATLRQAAVIDIFFKNTKLVYLSDIKPDGVNERPYIEGEGALVFTYRKDRCVCSPSKPLTVDGKTYRKGLGVHAYSLLQYRLNKQYARFNAVAGLDDTAGGQGSVEFKVYGDKKQLFASGVVAGKTTAAKIAGSSTGAKTVSLDVEGVDELMLVVDFGPDHDILDRAAWANAFLIRK